MATDNANSVDAQTSAWGMRGQVALITGGTSGIGKATALHVAQQGAIVILIGRDAERGEEAASAIAATVPGARVIFWRYDLSLMREVARLAEAVAANYPQLGIVVHAAGVMLPRRTLTAEGLETVFAIQYFARYHLTRLLLGIYGDQLRVVNVSAGGTLPIRVNFRNLNGERFYHGVYTLIHESVANDLFALKLMREHPALRYYNYGPFYVRTNLFADMPWWFKLSTTTFGRLMVTTPQVAAEDIGTLLAENRSRGFYSRGLKAITPSRYRRDVAVQDRLWAVSEQMIAEASARPLP